MHRGAAHSDHITGYANQKLENYKTHVSVWNVEW